MSDALRSARRKVVRALEHAKSCELYVADYTRRKPYKVIPQPNGTNKFKITEQPPIEISMFAGEILYHVRSALDHLFFELVQQSFVGVLPAELERACQFPLLDQLPTGHKPPVPKDKLLAKKGLFNWVPDDAYTFIESLQPYNSTDYVHEMLRILAKLSNIDKHHHLTTIAIIAKPHEVVTNSAGRASVVLGVELDNGAEYPSLWHPIEMNGEVQVERKMVLQIAFKEPELGLGQTTALEKVIYHLPSDVLRIVGRFEQFLG